MPIFLRSNCLTLALIAGIFGASLAFAQPVPPSTSAGPKTVSQSARERRKALEAEAAQNQLRRDAWNQRALEAVEARDRKRADCRRQAKEQNLHLMKRIRFVRKCMSSAPPR